MSSIKNDVESLSSLRSLQSANTVAELFSGSSSSSNVTDTSRATSSTSESSRKITSTSRLDKRKGLLRGCPHCQKHFPDYSALSSHVNVRLLQQHFFVKHGLSSWRRHPVEMEQTEKTCVWHTFSKLSWLHYLQSIHNRGGEYHCNKCHFKSRCGSILKNHDKVVHRTCPNCKKVFSQLERHIKSCLKKKGETKTAASPLNWTILN